MSETNVQDSVAQLRAAVEAGDVAAAEQSLKELPARDAALAVSRLSEEDQARLLTMLPDAEAAELVESLPESESARMMEGLKAAEAAAILDELPSDEQVDVIGRMSDEAAAAVLDRMAPEEAADVRRLIQYPPESAGGLMITEYLAYPSGLRVEDVLADLRRNAAKYRRYDVQYAYVVGSDGRLAGVLPLRDLVLADPDAPIAALMIRDPVRASVRAELEELERLFDRHPLYGLPVVDERGMLVGVVRREDVEQAAEERSGRSLLEFTGILGGEELRTMPLRLRSLRRLSWLSINIVLNIIAASVIAAYQETLSQAVVLAVFLPIISDMSGCSGNQAVAVSMRELALGLVRPSEFFRVLGKESAVGLINGSLLGLLLGLAAWLWRGNPALGFVVAAALALNTLVAVCIGGSVPLLLKGLGQDPALASGPILTTITDMCGFFFVLSLASALLPYLSGS